MNRSAAGAFSSLREAATRYDRDVRSCWLAHEYKIQYIGEESQQPLETMVDTIVAQVTRCREENKPVFSVAVEVARRTDNSPC